MVMAMEPNKIPPRSEWKDMSEFQLFEVRSKMMDTYYNMRGINATFANQYMTFIGEIDRLIERRAQEKLEADESGA
jgi:hypothetical protein